MHVASPIPILQTKLHRPPVAPDVVSRPRIIERLQAGCDLPLTLVSAPAGYGKSTIVTQLLDASSRPSVWLSLDERDNDLRAFTCYLIAAVRTRHDAACSATLARLCEAELPEPLALANLLINDLAQLDGHLLLAVDDFHVITDPGIHLLVEQFSNYPPPGIQLVLMTRQDPPLQLTRLRANSRMNEVRARDLALSAGEVGAFFHAADDLEVDAGAVSQLHSSTEGWPAGVRLARLALHAQGDVASLLTGFAEMPPDIYEYLANQVLAVQDPAITACLEQTSILDRMCVPLCEAVLGADASVSASSFVAHLEHSGLMVVALDPWGTWFRYHHLFQWFLQRRLERTTEPADIEALHVRAADWYASQDLIEEALDHYEAAGASDAAAVLVSGRVEKAMNDEQWMRLSIWLARLPRAVVDTNPRLLLAAAWWREYSTQSLDAHELGARAEQLLGEAPAGPDTTALLGEAYALRSRLTFMMSDMAATIELGRKALECIPARAASARGYALVLLASGLQLHGERAAAEALLADALADTASGPGYHARAITARCFIDWFEADLASLERYATEGAEFARRHELIESRTLSRYFAGLAHFYSDRLEQAERVLAPVLEARFHNRPLYDCGALFTLAIVNEQLGQPERATQMAKRLLDRAQAVRDPALIGMGHAVAAELALRRGDSRTAMDWADGFEPGPLLPPFLFFEPRFTLARILMARNRPGDEERAGQLLDEWLAYVGGMSGGYAHVIDASLTRAHLRVRRGNDTAASDDLWRALSLARTHGFKRFLVPFSEVLGPLSHHLDRDDELAHYARNIARRERAAGAAEPGPGPLSARELEVLQLMAARLTNKEIGKRLFISAGTVRRHAENIYRKLDVSGRREAVARAQALALL